LNDVPHLPAKLPEPGSSIIAAIIFLPPGTVRALAYGETQRIEAMSRAESWQCPQRSIHPSFYARQRTDRASRDCDNCL